MRLAKLKPLEIGFTTIWTSPERSVFSSMKKVISLFSGAGGMDIGFHTAGFEISVAIELDPSCCDTLKKNRDKFFPGMKIIQGDLFQISSEKILHEARLKPTEPALVIGGPPCQSFSLAGGRKGLNDPRGQLVKEFIRVVRDTLPVAFVMENVKGMLNWSGGRVIRMIEDEFKDPICFEGKEYIYNVGHALLNAADFGVPQHRERVFIVGNRLEKEFIFPVPVFTNSLKSSGHSARPYRTVQDAISQLGPADPPSSVALRVSQTIKGRIERHGY